MKQALAFFLAASLGTSAHALEGNLDGKWRIVRDPQRSGQVRVELYRGRTQQHGTLLSLDAFTGLAPAQVDAVTDTPVRFTLLREPGDTTFEGTFRRGKGSGTFTFASRPEFLERIRALGIESGGQDPEDLFGLAMTGLTVEFVRSLVAEGYRLPLDAYQSMRIFNVTPEYIREMRSLAFEHLSHDALVGSRIHGVTPEYVREMRAQGWNLSFEEYQANRIHGVTAEFAARMRRLGYDNLSRDDLLAFRIHGVTGEFILELRDLGYDRVPADDLIAARIHGVTPQFIREVERAGYRHPPFDDLLDLRIRGVRPDQLKRTRID